MKKSVNVLLVLLVVIFGAGFASATCNLDVALINQDPYPVRPGDSVEVVLQLSGVSDPGCGIVTLEIVEDFPFSLESGDGKTVVRSGTYSKGYKSELVAPYRFLVDEGAIDGNNELEVLYYTNGDLSLTEKFNISVEDVLTDFEISVKDYNLETHIITFEILNIGENDAEALTIDVPKQENLEIKGSSRNIVGSLDASEDTIFTFEAIPHDGEIGLEVLYTDETNTRRTISKKVIFDSSYFEDRKANERTPLSGWFYVALVLVLVILIYWYRERRRRKKKKEEYKRMHSSSEHHEEHSSKRR